LHMARLWDYERMARLFEHDDGSTVDLRNAYLQDLLERIKAPEPQDAQERAAQAVTDRLVDAIENGFKAMGEIAPDETEALARTRDDLMGTVKAILETPGFDVNRLGGPLQQPPLVVAITGSDAHEHVSELRMELTKYLLDHGADPDLPEKHPMAVDAVIRAAVLNHFEILRLLAHSMTAEAFAAALNERPAVNGLTALHDSVHRALTASPDSLDSHLEQIRWAVRHGARFDIEDHTGQTQEGLARAALNDPIFEKNAAMTLEALGLPV
ncbi:MAG: ankyrin repeat domain-containing protein, partial [Actinomycetota bacterium]|nr:ankyrin repeat domain-containing protein [Actinomycetota bacterium]